VDVGLVFGDLQGRHVLHNRIGAGKSERDVLVFGDAAAVEHDVARELRIGALEEAGHAYRERVDRAQVHRGVVVRDQFQRLRQREIAVGAAEGKKQIDG
jgi:hypothetical protein